MGNHRGPGAIEVECPECNAYAPLVAGVEVGPHVNPSDPTDDKGHWKQCPGVGTEVFDPAA